MFVPVVDKNNNPLMPTSPSRARKWIKSKKATYFWKKGIFCVRLNQEPKSKIIQKIVCGIDPGSKREAFTIKSDGHTYLNILTETIDWVKDTVEKRKNARRVRRFRNTPCRENRQNRRIGGLPPSTKARWQWKLNTSKWLLKMFPIQVFIVEDIKAKTKQYQKKWNKSFSPLEVGKEWFYSELRKLGELETPAGFETKRLRDKLGLKKSSSKLSDKFECHNVDSWVLAYMETENGIQKPENIEIMKIVPLQFHRRQLHVFQPSKNGVRREYGGTRSLGFKRGSLVRHKKYGICYVGGTSKERISVHGFWNGKRLSQSVKSEECKFLTYMSFRRDVISSTATKVA